jgi:hypothetical protein
LLKNQRLALLLALVCAGSMWFYVSHILVPFQRADAAAHDRPRGNLSDLYPRWLGSRELLLHHRDPYSREITREIQVGYYGRELDASREGDPRDQQGFAYPVYVAFLLSPSIGFPFQLVTIVFLWLLVVITAWSVPLWFRAIGWRPQPLLLWTAIVLTLGSFPAMQGLKLQQLTLVVAALISGAMALLAGGYLFAAGVILAVASIKPQLAVPITAALLLWTLSGWRRRQRFAWGYVITMALLFGGSEVLLPGWFSDFLGALRDYRNYAGRMSMLDVLLTPWWGGILTVCVVLLVAAVCWRFRSEAAGSREFAVMTALVLAVTVIIIPMFAPYNYILMLPSMLVLAENWMVLWNRSVVARAACVLGGVAVAWPWVASIGLTAVSLFLSPATVQGWWWLPLYTMAKIPMPIVCLLPLSMLVIMVWREREASVIESTHQAGMVA